MQRGSGATGTVRKSNVSICICSCKRPFWRYRKDFPPPGYCSVTCHENRRKKRGENANVRRPAQILQDMRDHRRLLHDSTSILQWFDCCRCEELEREYADSLDWHMALQTRLIAEDGRRQRASA